jgi:hypothetical protein
MEGWRYFTCSHVRSNMEHGVSTTRGNHAITPSFGPNPLHPPQKTPISAVPPATRPPVTSAPLTHVGNSSLPRAFDGSYIEQLRQMSSAQAAPYVELLPTAAPSDRPLATDRPLREALIQLLANVLAAGRDRISGREIFWRLRVPPQLEKRDGRDIARGLRSLGWVRCHATEYGAGNGGEWNVSAALVAQSATPEDAPLPVFRPHRAPIISIYGDDVPVYEATPEGIWAVIRYPLGPRLKIGTPRPPAKTHRWKSPPPAEPTAATSPLTAAPCYPPRNSTTLPTE